MPARVTVTLALVALSAASCSQDAQTATVAVATDDTTCTVATTEFAKPGTVTFEVENTGKKATEVYVYGKGSAGLFDKVVAEVEDIAPGSRRQLQAELTSGDYELACKPGQSGDGIRTPLRVQGATGSTAAAAYDREVEVTATDFAFKGLEGFTAKAGEKVELTLVNKGTQDHELEVFGPDGKAVGEIGPTKPGKDGQAVITLAKAGTYTYQCGIAGHADKGMKGSFAAA